MNRRIVFPLLALAISAFATPFTEVMAQTMTFDSLDPDFADYDTYLESGILLAGDPVAGTHFHAVPSGTGTGAWVFSTDGSPQLIRYNAPSWDLESIEFLSFDTDTTARIVASNGSTVTVGTPGRHDFGGSFENIQWARLEFDQVGSPDAVFQFDNINVARRASVPDAGVGSILIGLAAIGLAQRRISRR